MVGLCKLFCAGPPLRKRMTALPTHDFTRSTKDVLPAAAGGDGCYIIDDKGKRYRAAVSCPGHSDRTVTDAWVTWLAGAIPGAVAA